MLNSIASVIQSSKFYNRFVPCLLVVGLSFVSLTLDFVAQAKDDNVKLEGTIEINANGYHLGPGDVLKYEVYNQPNFSQDDILVLPDGTASFPRLREVHVEGKTVAEVREMLEDRLKYFIKLPEVTLTVRKTRPGTVYLVGAVMRPGMFQLTTDPEFNAQKGEPGIARYDLSISNVLTTAGGVMLNADLAHVEVHHGDSGNVDYVNLWKVLKDGVVSEDVKVRSGDTIIVPPSPTPISDEDYVTLLRSSIGPSVFPVRLLGQVNTPGVVDLPGTSPYLDSAIAKSGGFTLAANKKVVAIRRFTDQTHFTTLFISPDKYDFVLRPNDVVFVSENKVYLAGRFMDEATRILSPFASVAQSTFYSAAIFKFGAFRTVTNSTGAPSH